MAGREGDWECGSCRNRNYAFRTFCNRCKQPRLLVDTKTPADSKWLPRIGDWICPGCSNNNYASREKCKKCGQPKDESAMPAIAMQGASLSSYAHYLTRAHGLLGSRMDCGMMGNATLQQSLPPFSSWSYGGADKYELQSGSRWLFGGHNNGFMYGDNASQLRATPKGWRNGDWVCHCGFHNYSSRSQCKKCNAPLPSASPSMPPSTADIFPALGIKRLASEENMNDWDSKRLHAGDAKSHLLGIIPQFPYRGLDIFSGSGDNQISEMYSKYFGRIPTSGSHIQTHVQSPQRAITPTLIGKGAKQWRDGDWMCANCNNHNFASRSYCNRCKTEKGANVHPLSVV